MHAVITERVERFSKNIDALEPSPTLGFAAKARELREAGRSIIDLSAGEPEFPTPEYAAEAGIRAIREGHTHYPPTPGIQELRAAAARYLAETSAHAPNEPGRVLISAGAKQALFNCLYCLLEPGDEMIVPAPYWPSYLTVARLCGAVPVVVETEWEDGFQPSVEAIEACRTERTRALMINSPGNPTGAVYPSSLLAEIVEWCERNDVWLFSDEIYRRLYSSGPSAPSVYDIADRPEKTIVFDGVSKAFAMTGWRIGFAEGPPDVIKMAGDLQSQTTSGASSPAQYAAAAALGRSEEREAAIAGFTERLLRTRSLGVRLLEDLEALQVREPQGAIYLFAKLSGDRPSLGIAEELLDAGVACLAGEPFGSPGYLRFNIAVEEETLEEGLRRVVGYFEG